MFGFVVKKKKRNLFLSFLADSVFLKGKKFWLFLFSKEKKKGILFSERKKKDFFCFKNSVVSVLRNSVF